MVVPVALGLAGIGLILRPFLPSPKAVAVGVAAIACGLLLALPHRRPGSARRAAQGPLRSRLLPAPWGRPRRGPLLGHDDALPAPGRAHHRGHPRGVRVAAAHRPLRLGPGPGGRRGLDRAKRGTVGFATAIKESRINTDPDLVDTAPADTSPSSGLRSRWRTARTSRCSSEATSRRPRRSRTSTRRSGSPTSRTRASYRTSRSQTRKRSGLPSQTRPTANARKRS